MQMKPISLVFFVLIAIVHSGKPRFRKLAKVNPAYECPLTWGYAFIAPATNRCNEFSTSVSITASDISIDNSDIWMPMPPCAADPIDTFVVIRATFPSSRTCVMLIISNQDILSTTTFSTPFESSITQCDPYPKLCIYPLPPTTRYQTVLIATTTTVTGIQVEQTLVRTTLTVSVSTTTTTTRIQTSTAVSSITSTQTAIITSVIVDFTSETITISEDSIDYVTESETTTTYGIYTQTSTVTRVVSTVTARTIDTQTMTTTTCNRNIVKKAAMPMLRPTPYNFRVEQVQCPITMGGNVYNSNSGISASTICEIAGATQALATESILYTWLWKVLNDVNICPYAQPYSFLWVGSSAGNCYALTSTTTVIRPCNEVHPVICLSTIPRPPAGFFILTFTLIPSFTTVSTVTTSTTTLSAIATVTTRSVSRISLSVTEFVTVTTLRTVTTTTIVGSISLQTIYTLTTITYTTTEIEDTATTTLTSFVASRTVTDIVNTSTTPTTTTITSKTTQVINSCPVIRTRTMVIESTTQVTITSIIPIYSTITQSQSVCMADDYHLPQCPCSI